MRICLFGSASDTIGAHYLEQTEILGEAMANRGHRLVFGGGATGVMGAAARGVYRAGGFITGIAPGFFDQPGILTDLSAEKIITDTMRERKQVMEDLADAFIAAPGGIGTLDEFFEALTLFSLEQHSKPIAVYNIGGYYDGLLAFMKTMERENFVSSSLWDCMGIFDAPTPLLDYLESRQVTREQ